MPAAVGSGNPASIHVTCGVLAVASHGSHLGILEHILASNGSSQVLVLIIVIFLVRRLKGNNQYSPE
jgi:hypothetical protein